MTRRKILFVLVEGQTEVNALNEIINCIYDKNKFFVIFKSFNGDITTKKEINSSNIVSNIANFIKECASKYKSKSSDFYKIIHITDMDGAFVPEETVINDITAKTPFYSINEIRTHDKKGIEKRNLAKKTNLQVLIHRPKIWNIPYKIYYMSCNLDHVLYGKLNCTSCEKNKNARDFAKKYKTDIPSFLNFICKSEFSVYSEYISSWNYIQEGLHSLERHTNLGLCFKEYINNTNNVNIPIFTTDKDSTTQKS